MEFVLYIILAIVILLVMIIIHEFGHYIAGKIFKFKINEFSVGFGPKLLQKTRKNGEKITLRLIPLGGYCAFEGENEEGETPEKAFVNEKPYKRIIVLAAGAIFNIVSAVVFSFIYLLAVGYQSPVVTLVSYEPVTAVPYNALMQDDVITAVGGHKITPLNSLSDVLAKVNKDIKLGDKIIITVERFGEIREIEVERKKITPSYAGFGFEYTVEATGIKVQNLLKDAGGNVYNDQFIVNDLITGVNGAVIDKEGATIAVLTKDIGLAEEVFFTVVRGGQEIEIKTEKVRISLAETEGYGFSHAAKIKSVGFGGALLYSVPFTGKMSGMILGSFGQLFTGQIAVSEMAGPVGTVTQIAELGQTDWRNILILLPLLASNLAIFNLLPFPALDGARIVFTGIEWIRRKPINRKVENIIHFVGMVALMLFVVVVDIVGFITRGIGGGSAVWLRL